MVAVVVVVVAVVVVVVFVVVVVVVLSLARSINAEEHERIYDLITKEQNIANFVHLQQRIILACDYRIHEEHSDYVYGSR